MRLIFAGTPDFAASHLDSLLNNPEQEVVAVYTQPDRPAGRGKKLTPSPVKRLALAHDIPVYQPQSLKDVEAQQQLAALNADIMVVVAYGLILPQVVLDTPLKGCINVHASLLPRWRGAAPIQRAIEAGDQETGITIMQMDAGLDTGDMLLKTLCPINADETGGSLHDKLAELGPPALNETLASVAANAISAEPQNDEGTCYAGKISKDEAEIDWSLDARVIDRRIRAFNPFPVAFTLLNGQRIKIWRADIMQECDKPAGTVLQVDKHGIVIACGKGSLCLQLIQLPGKKAMDIPAVLNGNPNLFVPNSCLPS